MIMKYLSSQCNYPKTCVCWFPSSRTQCLIRTPRSLSYLTIPPWQSFRLFRTKSTVFLLYLRNRRFYLADVTRLRAFSLFQWTAAFPRVEILFRQSGNMRIAIAILFIASLPDCLTRISTLGKAAVDWKSENRASCGSPSPSFSLHRWCRVTLY